MKKAILIRSLLAGTLLFSAVVGTALAKDGTSGGSGSSGSGSAGSSSGSTAETQTHLATTTADRPATTEIEHHQLEQEVAKMHAEAKAEQRLNDDKKQKCHRVEANIDLHTKNFTAHTERQLKLFDSISQKVQDFAKRKNLTVAQEQTLLAQIATAKAKVNQDLSTLRSDSEAFKCDGANPKGSLKAFHSDAALVRSDLKAYRTSVRQLIQAVRQANGQSQTKSPETAKPETEKTTTGENNATHQ